MQLATTAGPSKLPVMPTTGPKDWEGVPLATFDWNNYKAQPVFASRDGFAKLDGVKTLEEALAPASRNSLKFSRGASVATAVLQAKDGAFYLATLGTLNGASSSDAYFFPNNGNTRVESVTPHVDALKAVVGGTSWVRLDAKAGDTAKPVDVS